jgi:hypothetical protein
MAITASDLVIYGSSNRPDSDTGAVGGAIDEAARPFTTPMTSAAAIELISSSSSDTRTATIVYRTSSGDTETWSPTLAGTCAILISTGTPEHLLSASLSSASTSLQAQIRISSGPTVHVFAFGETDGFALFQGAGAAPSSQEVRYEKLFVKNMSTAADLSAGVVGITSDPSTQYRIGLAATKDSTDGWANRRTDPGYTWVDSSSGDEIPGSTLGSGEAIGIGVEQTLAAGAGADDPEFLLQVSGTYLAST